MRQPKYIYPNHVGFIDDDDTNNCAVRALANASGETLEWAYTVFQRAGRRKHRGASISMLHAVYTAAGLSLVGVYGGTKQAIQFWLETKQPPEYNGMTLGRLLTTIKLGRYVAIVTGHAVAIVDNQVIDTGALLSNRRVTALYKVE